MARKKSKEQISYNMQRVRNKETKLETALAAEFNHRGINTYAKNQENIFGKPDFVFSARKIAVFCDGDFWHGYNWDVKKHDIKSNRDFWIAKIEKNMARDAEVNQVLMESGWAVFRFWGHDILKNVELCADQVENALRSIPDPPFRTIDLCAGIGGIRKGFELTGQFTNVLSAEIDKYACATYEHLFGTNPYNDITQDNFKKKVSQTPYDILLAGFPCQPFSGVGNKRGFDDESTGQIFFHLAKIIHDTRPISFLLENVDKLVTHNKGKTFNIIIDELVKKQGYYVVGVHANDDGTLTYKAKSFLRNSRDFGVPQNRPRTYIIGFDTERFSPNQLQKIPDVLPLKREGVLYTDLNDLLDTDVDIKYYMASGYLQTLKDHRQRQENKGYGFGYRIVNLPDIAHPIANTLLATGGSGRERNLIYDPKAGVSGAIIPGKKTPLNSEGIRVMTPNEWAKLQGFVNYAFLNAEGEDTFSFPENIPNVQKYKQMGNSVTIPVIEEMAKFILRCIRLMLGD